MEKSGSDEPQLPEGVSANDALNNLSAKEKAALAHAAGMTAQTYERFLENRAKKERIAATVSSVQKEKDSNPIERVASDVQAEEAVMKGVKEVLSRIVTPDVSPKREEEYYGKAYASLNDIEYGRSENPRISRNDAIHYFGYAIRARAVRELAEHIAQGASYEEASKLVHESFKRNAAKQNIPELGVAYEQTAKYIEDHIDNQKEWALVKQLIQHHEAGDLSANDRIFLQNMIACAKAVYFKGRFEPDMYERFRLQGFQRKSLDLIIDAYRKYGPHKTKTDNVSGPTEVYGSTQSGDRNMGYNRTGKRRPQRDPSGGSGEKF